MSIRWAFRSMLSVLFLLATFVVFTVDAFDPYARRAFWTPLGVICALTFVAVVGLQSILVEIRSIRDAVNADREAARLDRETTERMRSEVLESLSELKAGVFAITGIVEAEEVIATLRERSGNHPIVTKRVRTLANVYTLPDR